MLAGFMRGGVIQGAKQWIKARWPRLRLRTILFATLFVVAALPGMGAVFLRVYGNTLVRQTEAELISQGAALSATAALEWPFRLPRRPDDPIGYRPEPPAIDLSSTPILPERPAPFVPPPEQWSGALPDAVEAAGRMASVIATTRRTTLASILLLDVNGRIASGPQAGRSYRNLPEVDAALSGEPATVLRRNASYRATYRFEWLSRAADIRVHHARPVVVGGRVVAVLLLSRSARGLFKGIYDDRGKIALGVAAILATLVILSGLLSRGVTRPIEELGRATRAVAAGRGGVPDAPRTAAVEIQALYADFAAMADAIERRSRYLRDFAHAVSHEFKTPLAGIRGTLELLGDHGATMSAAERGRFLHNADADAGRLALLVTRLLDLARADMTAAAHGARSEIAPVLAKVADALRGEAFAVRVDAPGGLPPVAVPAATVEAVLTGLVENSRQAGATSVAITACVTDRLLLTVADDGPDIAPADRARVFEPFFTTRREQGGSGLGLAIVRSTRPGRR